MRDGPYQRWTYRPDSRASTRSCTRARKDIQARHPTSCRLNRRTRRCGSVRSKPETRGASSPTAMCTSSHNRGVGEVGRSLRPRRLRPLRPDPVDRSNRGPTAKSAWWGSRATPASNGVPRLGPPRVEGHLPVRRLQRLRRDVRLSRLQPGGDPHVPHLLDVFSTVHESRDVPGDCRPSSGPLARAMRNRTTSSTSISTTS